MAAAGAVKLFWTDEELAAAVEVYAFILRLQRADLAYDPTEISATLRAGALSRRNDASVRYRLRNISDVALEMGFPALVAFPPATKTGRHVRERLRRLLSAHPGLQDFRGPPIAAAQASPADAPAEAVRQLALLEPLIEDLNRAFSGMGHNRPPEPISDGGIDPADFAQALEDIRALKAQMATKPDPVAATPRVERLKTLGVKIAAWWGQRGTKVADEVVKAMLLPLLVAALAAVMRAVGL